LLMIENLSEKKTVKKEKTFSFSTKMSMMSVLYFY